jgi:hypothetical protein
MFRRYQAADGIAATTPDTTFQSLVALVLAF